MAEQPTPQPDEEFRKNAKGHMVPLSLIDEIDLLRDELVGDLVKRALGAQDALQQFKRQAFADIAAFVDLSAEQYDVKLGGKKGNVTLTSYDGAYKVQLAIQERMTFDERLQAAKALVDECLTEWSAGARDEIRVLVQAAFQVDKEGRINTGRVLSLRRLAITDPKWLRAMQAIADSLQVADSKAYVRFSRRVGTTDKYEPIALDLATV